MSVSESAYRFESLLTAIEPNADGTAKLTLVDAPDDVTDILLDREVNRGEANRGFVHRPDRRDDDGVDQRRYCASVHNTGRLFEDRSVRKAHTAVVDADRLDGEPDQIGVVVATPIPVAHPPKSSGFVERCELIFPRHDEWTSLRRAAASRARRSRQYDGACHRENSWVTSEPTRRS